MSDPTRAGERIDTSSPPPSAVCATSSSRLGALPNDVRRPPPGLASTRSGSRVAVRPSQDLPGLSSTGRPAAHCRAVDRRPPLRAGRRRPLSVTTRDASGDPVAATVVLRAVDEKLFASVAPRPPTHSASCMPASNLASVRGIGHRPPQEGNVGGGDTGGGARRLPGFAPVHQRRDGVGRARERHHAPVRRPHVMARQGLTRWSCPMRGRPTCLRSISPTPILRGSNGHSRHRCCVAGVTATTRIHWRPGVQRPRLPGRRRRAGDPPLREQRPRRVRPGGHHRPDGSTPRASSSTYRRSRATRRKRASVGSSPWPALPDWDPPCCPRSGRQRPTLI